MKTYEFTVPARIVYDPYRGAGNLSNKWWCVAELDKEVTRYYRWWIKSRYHIELFEPSWNAHISIIRGEEPPADKKHLWGKYNGETVMAKYSHFVRQSGDVPGPYEEKTSFWFVDATHERFTEIRNQFGFPSNWKQHLTIGRVYNDIGLRTKLTDR